MTTNRLEDPNPERSEIPSNDPSTEEANAIVTPSEPITTQESETRSSNARLEPSQTATNQPSKDVLFPANPEEPPAAVSTPGELNATYEVQTTQVETDRSQLLSRNGSTQEPNEMINEEPLNEQQAPLRSQPWHHLLATDILDKQYRLYSWNDAKSLSLITTNSVLLAAIGFLFKECLPDFFALLAIMVALVLVATSLYFSLKQVIPQGSSGKSGAGPNVRALRSINEFENWESYHAKLLGMDEEESLQCAARQIYGMAHNNDVSRRTTTRGVRLTSWGIGCILLSTVGVALSSRNVHPLGQWMAKSPEATQKFDQSPISTDKSGQEVRTPTSSSPIVANPSPTVAQPSPSNGSLPKSKSAKKTN